MRNLLTSKVLNLGRRDTHHQWLHTAVLTVNLDRTDRDRTYWQRHTDRSVGIAPHNKAAIGTQDVFLAIDLLQLACLEVRSDYDRTQRCHRRC